MLDNIGKRLIAAAVGLVAGFLGTKFLDAQQAKEFMDFALAIVASFTAGQTVSDSVKAWKSPQAAPAKE